MYFNFAQGTINPADLAFSNVSIGSSTYTTLLAPTTGATVSGLKADGDGYFDGKIQFSENNFLGNNQTLSFHLSVVNQDLGVDDFHFFSLPGGGSGSYIMAAHMQNMPSTGDSLWVGTVAAVPLPGSLLFFGSGLMGMLGFRKSRRQVI